MGDEKLSDPFVNVCIRVGLFIAVEFTAFKIYTFGGKTGLYLKEGVFKADACLRSEFVEQRKLWNIEQVVLVQGNLGIFALNTGAEILNTVISMRFPPINEFVCVLLG